MIRDLKPNQAVKTAFDLKLRPDRLGRQPIIPRGTQGKVMYIGTNRDSGVIAAIFPSPDGPGHILINVLRVMLDPTA